MLATMVLWFAAPLAVQLWDRRRLDEAQRDRSWNYSSWGSALYAFGPLSMLGWYVVTRRGLRRALGIPVTAALWLVLAGVDLVFDALA